MHSEALWRVFCIYAYLGILGTLPVAAAALTLAAAGRRTHRNLP